MVRGGQSQPAHLLLAADSLACAPRVRLQGWEDAVNNWQEIPKGGLYKGDIKKIWYNHAVNKRHPVKHCAPAPRAPDAADGARNFSPPQIVPLWAAIGLASVVCGGFLIKYFGGHTEISWSKSMRATYDHQVRRWSCVRRPRRVRAPPATCARRPPNSPSPRSRD